MLVTEKDQVRFPQMPSELLCHHRSKAVDTVARVVVATDDVVVDSRRLCFFRHT